MVLERDTLLTRKGFLFESAVDIWSGHLLVLLYSCIGLIIFF